MAQVITIMQTLTFRLSGLARRRPRFTTNTRQQNCAHRKIITRLIYTIVVCNQLYLVSRVSLSRKLHHIDKGRVRVEISDITYAI